LRRDLPERVRSAAAGSSRPPRTGSIAAYSPRSTLATSGPVVPSAKDGLHCGSAFFAKRARYPQVVPSAKDGLHCGHLDAAIPRTRYNVVPSAKDGLHCGGLSPAREGPLSGSSRPPRTGSIAATPRGTTRTRAACRPVRQGRAPLRPRDRHRALRVGAGRPVRQGRALLRHGRRGRAARGRSSSSRPPRTGSIAARASTAAPCSSSTSSRPPRTGSIAAAADPGHGDRDAAGRPVRQGRAPLRLIPEAGMALLPLRRPVRQGRAPLRRGLAGMPVLHPRGVVPSAKDGLHCG